MRNFLRISIQLYNPSDGHRRYFPFYVSSLSEFIETVAGQSLSSLHHIYRYDGIDECDADLYRLVEYQNDGDGRFAAEVRAIGRVLIDWANCPNAAATDAWKRRERNKMRNGVYRTIPASLFSECYIEPVFDHFLHMPTDMEASGDMIAFTESSEKGQRDVQKRMKFGKYLKQFYPHLSDSVIQSIVLAYRALSAPLETEFKTTTDREKINEIFESVVCPDGQGSYSSCMSGKFSGERRPYHVYADSPDVAIAYMTEKGSDKPLARSVAVTTDHKRYIRIYTVREHKGIAAETLCTRFEEILKEQGFKEGSLCGARLSKVGHLMPYLDGGANYINDDGKYWIVSDEEDCDGFTAQNTDGTMSQNEDDRSTCSYCSDRMDEDDEVYSDYHEETYCRGCIDSYFTEAVYRVGARGREETTYVMSDRTQDACDGTTWVSDIIADYLAYSDDDSEYHVDGCGCDAMKSENACDGNDYHGSDRDELIEDSDGDFHVSGCDCEIMGAHYEHENQTTLADVLNAESEKTEHSAAEIEANNEFIEMMEGQD